MLCKTVASCVGYREGTEPWVTSAGIMALLRVQIVRGYAFGLCGSTEKWTIHTWVPVGQESWPVSMGMDPSWRVPRIRWWQRIGLVCTVFWIIKYHTYWPDCNSKLNLSTTTWLEGHAQDNNNLQYHLIHSFYKYINTIYSAQYTLLTWKYLLTNCH